MLLRTISVLTSSAGVIVLVMNGDSNGDSYDDCDKDVDGDRDDDIESDRVGERKRRLGFDWER
jgi:hypothetical protein